MIKIFLSMGMLIVAATASLSVRAQSPELNAAFDEYQTLSQQEKFPEAIQFAQKFIRLAEEEFGKTHPIYAAGLGNLAWLYHNEGRYSEAEQLFLNSLAISENALGKDHRDVLESLDNLAAFYRRQGRYKDAEPFLKRSLAIREKALGMENQDIAQNLNNLASNYQDQGRYAEAEPFYKRSLAIWEKDLGSDHLDVATGLNNLAELYRRQGRYAEGEALYMRSLLMRENALGPDHQEVARSLNNLASLYSAQGRYAEAERLFKRSLMIRDKALGPDHSDVAFSLNNLALLYVNLGRYADAEPLYKRSMKIFEKALGLNHPNVATGLNNLAELYRSSGRYTDAEPFYNQSLAIFEKIHGPDHSDVAHSINNLALLYFVQGRYADAEPLYKRSIAIFEKTLGPDHPSVATGLNNLSTLHEAQGRYTDSEPLLKRALSIFEEALGPDHPDVARSLNDLAFRYVNLGRYADAEPLFKRSLMIKEKALGQEHQDVATSLSGLASLYNHQGRYADTEPLFKRSLAILEKALGPDHPDVARSLNDLAFRYVNLGRYADAEPLLKRSLAIGEKAFGPDHPGVAQTLSFLGSLYKSQGRYAEAEPPFKRSLAIDEKALGPDHPEVASVLGNLASLHIHQGRDADAEPLIKRSLSINERALGPDHPSVPVILTNLTSLYQYQNRYEEALSSIRRATNILRRRGIDGASARSGGAETERKGSRPAFQAHASIAFAVSEQNPSQSAALYDEAFEVSQLAQTSSAASALSQMTARLGAGDSSLANAVRSQQDLRAFWLALDKDLLIELSKPQGERRSEREARLRADIAKTEARLDALDSELAEKFPQYAELTKPQPLKGADAQQLLGTDEALIVYNASYLWLVRRDDLRMLKVDTGSQKITDLVTGIRKTLEPRDGKLIPFDAASSFELYTLVLEPAARYLQGIKHLMVVPDGSLQSIPFGLLVTEPPSSTTKPAWLATQYALTTLPSVSSLRALRVLGRKDARQTAPFTGFGDPVLKGKPSDRRGISIVSLFNSGDKADPEAIRKLAALPESAGELREIARSLNAKEGSLYLGNRATETTVKRLDLSGTGVLAFATHGLVSGEGGLAAEPGLVMTPPANATLEDDGILTASEVAQLKLYPGLVILSACNTAAADGKPGAEGLSGLARAFFYAGSQTLLVSHWAVESDAAKQLTTGMFAALKSNPGIGRAEALRRSMLKLAANDNFAHPAFWAPFSLVGEGAAGR